MTRSRQTADWGSRAGLAKIVPSSVAVGSGTGSADSLGTVTFSGASTLSLNGIFTAAYNHYKIVSSNTGSTSITALSFKMRANGTDSTGLYYGGANGANSESNYTIFVQLNAVSSMRFGVAKSGETATVEMRISNPFSSSARTQFANSYTFTDGTNGRAYYSGGSNVESTSFDGFTLIPDTGTITGTISVYGFN